MNFKHVCAVFVWVQLGCVSYAQTNALQPAARETPPGIPRSAWIAISDTVGFVITKAAPTVVTDGAGGKQAVIADPDLPGTIIGYFMVYRDGRWIRLETEPSAARVFDATKASEGR